MSVYISQQGLDKLKQEFQERVRITRRQIADAISSAKELGDISENFEYQDAKEQQALNEARIAQLELMIHDAVLVENTTGNQTIGLGCTFVAFVNGVEKTFTIVGSSEADPLVGKISNESPLGRAFSGHTIGETISAHVPSGIIEYRIIRIE